jgi:hypothetical protein
MVCSMLHLRAHPGLRAVLLTSLRRRNPHEASGARRTPEPALGFHGSTEELWRTQQHAPGLNNTNSGTINGFDIATGVFVGTIRDSSGKLIQIDQLWGIEFGDGLGTNGRTNQLFFTAGPSDNLAGTFGVITFEK